MKHTRITEPLHKSARPREWGPRTLDAGALDPDQRFKISLPTRSDNVRAVRPPRPRVLAPTPGVAPLTQSFLTGLLCVAWLTASGLAAQA
ncbi:MAG: hypothetical protein ACM368_07210, partial [Gemmatimonadota bacterium]